MPSRESTTCGSQAQAATAASSAQETSEPRHPPKACSNGTAAAAETVAPRIIAVEYSAVIPAALSGKSRLIRPGISTLSSAMPEPTTAQPAKSVTMGGAIRSAMPPASRTSAPSSTVSVPHRRASLGARGEITPMKMSGMVVTRLLIVEVIPKWSLISPSTGDTPASAARMFKEASTMPTNSSTGCVRSRPRAAATGGDGARSSSASNSSASMSSSVLSPSFGDGDIAGGASFNVRVVRWMVRKAEGV